MLNDYLRIPEKSDRRTTSPLLKATASMVRHRWQAEVSMVRHHALRENSISCYSRDLLSKPMRELCGLLLNLRFDKPRHAPEPPGPAGELKSEVDRP